ncbi:MAG: DUF4124 domain-containing protein [Xanthomonadales bacterium]|nr:DUF4124 domain-containing protein [Xanthomonadales bacterium]
MRALALILMLMMAIPGLAQKIYKTVDEDGNVVYTDEPPTPDAEPMDLPPITVADPFTAQPTTAAPGDADEAVVAPYPNLAMVSPASEEHFWGTGGTFRAQLAADSGLRPGDSVRFYLDGELAGIVQDLWMEFTSVDRGEHKVRAEIVDGSGQVVATTPEVTFFMRQHSIQHRNSRSSGDHARSIHIR